MLADISTATKKNQLQVYVEQYAHRAQDDMPVCSSSVILEYRDRKQNTVAYVHQYRRTNRYG